jgi:hypothetical protein
MASPTGGLPMQAMQIIPTEQTQPRIFGMAQRAEGDLGNLGESWAIVNRFHDVEQGTWDVQSQDIWQILQDTLRTFGFTRLAENSVVVAQRNRNAQLLNLRVVNPRLVQEDALTRWENGEQGVRTFVHVAEPGSTIGPPVESVNELATSVAIQLRRPTHGGTTASIIIADQTQQVAQETLQAILASAAQSLADISSGVAVVGIHAHMPGIPGEGVLDELVPGPRENSCISKMLSYVGLSSVVLLVFLVLSGVADDK